MTASTGRMLALAPSTNFVTTPSMAISQLTGISGSPQPRDDLPIFALPVVSPKVEPQSACRQNKSKTLAEPPGCHPPRSRICSRAYFSITYTKKQIFQRGILQILNYPYAYT